MSEHDEDGLTVGMCVVYPKRTGRYKYPDDAVAAFKSWDEAEEYQRRRFPDGLVVNQAVSMKGQFMLLRMLGGMRAEPVDFCNFCRKPVDEFYELQHLVKGEGVAICSDCLVRGLETAHGDVLFSVAYLRRGAIEDALIVNFDDGEGGADGLTGALRREIAEAIEARLRKDAVLERLREAVNEQMIDLFYRELAARTGQLEAAGLPIEYIVAEYKKELDRRVPPAPDGNPES